MPGESQPGKFTAASARRAFRYKGSSNVVLLLFCLSRFSNLGDCRFCVCYIGPLRSLVIQALLFDTSRPSPEDDSLEPLAKKARQDRPVVGDCTKREEGETCWRCSHANMSSIGCDASTLACVVLRKGQVVCDQYGKLARFMIALYSLACQTEPERASVRVAACPIRCAVWVTSSLSRTQSSATTTRTILALPM